jgi:DHA3 family multidrug efflux protein-like MFS transporter
MSKNPEPNYVRSFYLLLGNTTVAMVTNMTVWFALIFFTYLQTQAVIATSIISGLYLIATATSGIWFGSLVDHNKKKNVMLVSSLFSLVVYAICFALYIAAGGPAGFTQLESPVLWLFVVLILLAVTAGGVRSIATPTLVTIMIPAEDRDKTNGIVGTALGIAFLIVSVISAFLVGHSGMFLVLILAIVISALTIAHLWLTEIPEREIVHLEGQEATSKLDLKGTIKAVRAVPGLFALIFFTTFNNFLGGVFMSLMDAYGLSLVSVEVWGILWGILSTAFIVGGLLIARLGLGKNPVRAMFLANISIWVISCFFTIQPSIVLLFVGMFLYLAIIPFIEAAEHTIIQKVVSPERQGRVFGFAHSVEQAASPFTAFLIGPITQFIFIPFMTTGAGVELIGGWFGTGSARGIALVFTIVGIIGLLVTMLATRSRFYRQLSAQFVKN